ncbi:zinc finger, C3HC4 type (RING finger) protein (macronuclear) [Tetrahymena thermophila SB210]|uniref:E3 ubiquitin protein ligase n=1 Tax=Tetrahymena thermophila (strain SB210) TaxID=312017 RepID=Q24DT4_TETTS|nr:zinc finger, C3HC4 type (RING finger) protein [Tetrahymena thermophila SB210]EAS05906.2 zinc finger, C3HC4 type (RING finger) protein [Tetrahymena thermophila SB210]|eukprot:XP_001026151.2 zinc finger, C3HC4 type (RING finger) protein [Tetrahymena thermophila SB210]
MEKTTKDALSQIPNSQTNSSTTAIGGNSASNANNTNAVSKQRAQTNAAALQDLQKITKQRVENFLKNFENIYADVAIDCATYGQRMNDAVKSLAQNNDANETMRRLYRENSQLQTKIKEQESYLSKSVPLADTEKDFIMNYFGNQSKQYEELLQKYNEEREISERLSLRIRQKMDYCVTSITAKVGQDPNQILQKIIQNNANSVLGINTNNAASMSGKENQNQPNLLSSQSSQNLIVQQQQNQMEIEDQTSNANNNNSQQENRQEEKEGYECICGGYQTEYFSQKYEETLKQLLDTQQKLIATQTIINTSPSSVISTAFTQPVVVQNSQNGNSMSTSTVNGLQTTQSLQQQQQQQQEQSTGNQNGQSNQQTNASVDAVANSDGNKNNCQNLELNGSASVGSSIPCLKKSESIQIQQQLLSQPALLTQVSTNIQDELCDGKLRLPITEKLQILQKRNEQLVQEKSELEKYMREREIDLKNMEDKFFRSGAYQSLATQTEELLKITIQMRSQLKEAKQQISDIEKQRFREMQEVLTKFKDEKETLLKQLHEAREGVYKTQLGDAMRENLTQHFNYKKYTQPLEDQLEKASEILTIEREHNRDLEQKKQQLNEQIIQLQKQNSDLQAKLNEKEQQINYLQSQMGFTGESYVEDKIFKYQNHKDTLKLLEKVMNDMCSAGQINQEQIKKFRDLIEYIRNREEKIVQLQKVKQQNDIEKKKLQQNQDEIWKEYENLDKSFSQMKARCDQVNQELKLIQEREQGLEYKNLEIQMQFQKEKQSYSILVAADQQKKDNTKNLIDNLEDQNKQLLQQNSNLSSTIEEVNQQKQLIQQQLEENTVLLLDTQQKFDLLNKKFGDINEKYNELIANHEKIQQKLQTAYEVLDNSESKNTSAEVAQLKEKIQNMRLLLQCSCGQNFKDTILQKCLHPFCRECIDKQIRLRQRTCPKCRTAFGQNDVKTLYLSH